MEKYADFINECSKEFEAKNTNNYYRITLSDKMSNIVKKVDELTKTKCPEQLQRIQSLMQFKNVEGRNQAVPVEGKELEAQKALQDLVQCQGPLGQMLIGIQSVNKISETIVSNELQLCLEDCINIENEDNAKSCIKTCFNNTFKYTLTASQKLMENTARQIEEQLKKL